VAPTHPPRVEPQMRYWSSSSTHRASIASESRATPYMGPSPVLSTVDDYTLEEGYASSFNTSNQTLTCSLLRFKFQVLARGLSVEPAEIKEWKPETSWDYTIRIEGIKTQMGAKIKINLNNPIDIPTGSLGLWIYMKKEGSDDHIEGQTCGYCEKRQRTNVSRFKDMIDSEQAHTRIICSTSDTWLEPLPDNAAYTADVSFLIWCPAYHEARTDPSQVRVKQARQHFQYVGFPHGVPRTLNIPCRLVCELRDHTHYPLADATLRRTWGGNKRSRESKKDASGRSGHRASISGEPTAPHADSHNLPGSHAHPSSPRSDKRTPLLPPSNLPPIEIEASSPTPTHNPFSVKSEFHEVSLQEMEEGRKLRAEMGASKSAHSRHDGHQTVSEHGTLVGTKRSREGTGRPGRPLKRSRITGVSSSGVEPMSSTSGTPVLLAVPPSIRPPEVHVLEDFDTPAPDDDVVEIPVPAKPPVVISVGSSSPHSGRSPAPSPESPGRSPARSALGPRIIVPSLTESVMEMPARPDFLGVWREEGRIGDEVQLIGAGFNRETEYFAKFGAAPPIQVWYQASHILRCIVPCSGTTGTVAVSIVSRDGSTALCEQQQPFRYLSSTRFEASVRISRHPCFEYLLTFSLLGCSS